MSEPSGDYTPGAQSERAPSAWTLERAIAAYQRLCTSLFSDDNTEEDENRLASEMLRDVAIPRTSYEIEEARGQVEHLLSRLIDATVWAELRATEAKTIENQFNARRERYEDRAERMREMIDAFMLAVGIEKHAAKLATASYVKTAPSVVITDAEAIPDEYVNVTRTPRRTAIKEDIKQGVVIPGAALSNGGTALQLRRIR